MITGKHVPFKLADRFRCSVCGMHGDIFDTKTLTMNLEALQEEYTIKHEKFMEEQCILPALVECSYQEACEILEGNNYTIFQVIHHQTTKGMHNTLYILKRVDK